MKYYRLKVTAVILGIIGYFAILGIAGDIDYCDQIILHMTYAEYAWVKDTLTRLNDGRQPSEREIAHWWEDHHKECQE